MAHTTTEALTRRVALAQERLTHEVDRMLAGYAHGAVTDSERDQGDDYVDAVGQARVKLSAAERDLATHTLTMVR